jgi:integrase
LSRTTSFKPPVTLGRKIGNLTLIFRPITNMHIRRRDQLRTGNPLSKRDAKMGSIYKRKGSANWMMTVSKDKRQLSKSTHTSNKRLAQHLVARWDAEVFDRRFQLQKSNPPLFEDWADDCLKKVSHPNTRKRYGSSIGKLKTKFSKLRLSEISADGIDEYVEARLAEGIEPATINHDVRILGKLLRRAERKRLISYNPIRAVEPLKLPPQRFPHIVTFEEEEKILQVAVPHIRVLVVLILETGLRSHREALALKWEDVDFVNCSIRVRESKTRAGVRNVPLSTRCKEELWRWRDRIGREYSQFVFPNLRTPIKPMKDIRHSWKKALTDAGLEYFWVYNLRHSHASRLSAAGVSDLFVAQMIGHSSPGILQKYSKAIDEYRRDAIRKLEVMRAGHTTQ